ncbi:D-glycero-alpha-D-manno-heptose-1,7-bisphosphate 7-phosphatase [Streptomyces sp. NPDC059989]|uniref:D-glycero-alpha-D-manno-heptose-1,7-bisphosphate 7-phosphatase n=1 Tax=Streptomyces sp. NPDC059989 TaxID=3347026 RepID=UPI0036BC1B5E
MFLDRDGVLNDLWWEPDLGTVDSPLRPDQVRLKPGAAEAVKLLNERDVACVVVSNQPVVAKGKTSWPLLDQVTHQIVMGLAHQGAVLNGVYYCVHHPDAVIDGLRVECPNRKPSPGLLREAAGTLGLDLGSSWMIGDTSTDVTAGRSAGCRTAWVGTRRCDACATWCGDGEPDLVARDLYEAVETILNWSDDVRPARQR